MIIIITRESKFPVLFRVGLIDLITNRRKNAYVTAIYEYRSFETE